MRRRLLLLAITASSIGCDAKETAPPVARESAAVTSTATAPSETVATPSSGAPSATPSSSNAPEPPAPEELARGMKGTIPCGKQRCAAGKQICVAAPDPGHVSHCEPIAKWVDGRTPYPQNGAPPMAGLTACDGSHNCPEESVCCLHEIGNATVQAVVCHASLEECRDRVEMCNAKVAAGCRTPGTHCDDYRCVKRPSRPRSR